MPALGAPPPDLPPLDRDGCLEVEIEVARFAFVKRDAAGAVQLASPLPCPFNYGSVIGTRAADGDAVDALVLGSRLARGTRLRAVPRAVVRFVDAGLPDAKWICSRAPLRAADIAQLEAFFTAYALFKRAVNALRSPGTETRYDRLERFRA